MKGEQEKLFETFGLMRIKVDNLGAVVQNDVDDITVEDLRKMARVFDSESDSIIEKFKSLKTDTLNLIANAVKAKQEENKVTIGNKIITGCGECPFIEILEWSDREECNCLQKCFSGAECVPKVIPLHCPFK